jgi:cytochrome c553
MMKQQFSLLVLAMGSILTMSVFAEGHHVAEPWTVSGLHANLAAMPVGDAVRGEKLNIDMMCASCHGDGGQALSRNWPSTAGQRAEYTYKTLQDYASGRFVKHQGADAMAAVSGMLSQQDMADLAGYYATKALPVATVQVSLSDDAYRQTDYLVRQGDVKRLITPCASCHGTKGEGGINETPAIAGQDAYVFERSMQTYKQATRESDVHAAMRQFAKKLTDTEINNLAAYYAMQPKAVTKP